MAFKQHVGQDSRTPPLLGLAVVVAVLYFAREVFIPIAVSVLLAFLLGPLVKRLRRHGLNNISAVLTATLIVLLAVGGIFAVIIWQSYGLITELPTLRTNLLAKIDTLRLPEDGLLNEFGVLLEDIQREWGEQEEELGLPVPDPATDAAEEPLPVEIKAPRRTPLERLSGYSGTFMTFAGQVAIVFVFMVFILLQQDDLRDRFLRLSGADRLIMSTTVLDDAGRRVSRYLLMQLLVNSCNGLAVAIGLYFIGVPSPVLWGLLGATLRFIPYVGPWIAASVPIAISAFVEPGWETLIWTVLLFIVIELVSNNVIEPWAYGASTGMSQVAIIVAAVFWTWLWGPVGLLLSTPLTVCLVVLGNYVPGLQFLHVLLSDEPALTPAERFYQRLLAFDQESATDIAVEHVGQESLVSFYDDLMVPALRLAEEDRHRGAIDDMRVRFVMDSTRDLVETLRELSMESEKASEDNDQRPPRSAVAMTIAYVPAKDEADEIAGEMLAHVLGEMGIEVKVLAHEMLTGEVVEEVEKLGVGSVCVGGVPPFASRQARYHCKRLRLDLPTLQIVVGLWGSRSEASVLRQRLPGAIANTVVTSIREAVDTYSALLAAPAAKKLVVGDSTPEIPRVSKSLGGHPGR